MALVQETTTRAIQARVQLIRARVMGPDPQNVAAICTTAKMGGCPHMAAAIQGGEHL